MSPVCVPGCTCGRAGEEAPVAVVGQALLSPLRRLRFLVSRAADAQGAGRARVLPAAALGLHWGQGRGQSAPWGPQ